MVGRPGWLKAPPGPPTPSSRIVACERAWYLACLAGAHHRMESDPMTTPGAVGGSSPIPQLVAALLTRAAIFLVGTINPGAANEAAVRSLCADLAALLRSIGFREPA